MNQSKELRRVHRRTSPVPELLEDRMVLSAGEGSTFAIMPGSVTTAGQVSTINFKIDPTLFTAAKKNGHMRHRNRHRAGHARELELEHGHPDAQARDLLAHRRLDRPGDPHRAHEVRPKGCQGG